jgi:DNA processing protein
MLRSEHTFEGSDVSIPVREQAAVLALTAASTAEWYKTATLIVEAGGALALLDQRISSLDESQKEAAEELAARVSSDDVDGAEALIVELQAEGVRLVTVLDDDYPLNLHQVYNRPPFLFVRGALVASDTRSIAVVGTRKPSERGLQQARTLASGLAETGTTVLSGLALGIDTAAHEAALEAGGRTVAVLGAGIRAPVYPPANAPLASRIADTGALASQFWPDAPPTRFSFPMRNVVMSGMAVGTVVIEASSKSGAKMQARFALEHGKRLFLLESLVLQQEWAQRYAKRPGAVVVQRVEDVLEVLASANKPTQQLTFSM